MAKLPPPPRGWLWQRVLDTAAEDPFAVQELENRSLPVPGDAIAMAVLRPRDA